MSLKILNKYELDGLDVTEYTKDGETVSHTVKTPIQTEPIEPSEPEPPQEEINTLTYLNTEYLVVMSELTNL